MKRLGGTDAVFLSMEMPSWHQHVGGLTILEPGDEPVTFERLVTTVEERIGYAPKFTWRLKHVPLGFDRPVWVDDPSFDVHNHVRRIAVPSPGGRKEVGEVAGMLLSTQLDRRRPLWEVWYVEGLAHGRVALVMKYHHCLLDGVASASLATVLMDLEPNPAPGTILTPSPTEEEARAGDASDLGLIAESVWNNVRHPLHTARYVTGLAAKGLTMVDRFRRDERSRALISGPKTPFNEAIGPRRELAFASVALDDVRAVKARHDVKVNDVVLALCSTAMRNYLLARDALPDASLVTGVPVSLRAEGDQTMDNQVTTMFAFLATDLDDPVDRLHEIHRSANSAKEMTEALSAHPISSLGEVAAPLVLGAAFHAIYRGQLISRSPCRVNTCISNVPGPPVPLYLCGASITGVFPCSVILEGMGLNFTVLSYNDRLDFGLHVDPDLVPDPWTIVDGIPSALAELMAASSLGALTPVDDPFGPPVDASRNPHQAPAMAVP
ncbi:MAG: wax ester/triacylglycerol synthase family O-acyltransferase [Actinobacteria bacterium]|nr:wax ester/triacylglycerol synthase family O-acyltransferase [Actinomycetota bacterium]